MQDNNDGRSFLIHVESRRIDKVREYLENGGDVNFRGILGETALHKASDIGDLEMCQLLLAHHDVQISAFDHVGYTPLHNAVYRGALDIIEVLIKHRANVNLMSENSGAPLHIAVQGDSDTTLLLLEAGADVNILNCAELPPLDIAIEHRHKENCILLLQYGADPNLCRVKLTATKFFTDLSQEAFEILEHNGRSMLEMVAYSLALSRFLLPFEMIKEVWTYYESPYWCEKFNTEDIDKLREVVLPTHCQKLLKYGARERDLADSQANNDGRESIACSNTDTFSQVGETHSTADSCSDQDNTLSNETAVVVSNSEVCYSSTAGISGNDQQAAVLLNEMLRWISTLPVWLQEHMMSLHLVARLMELVGDGNRFILGDVRRGLEGQYVDFTKYDAVPYTVQNARATDYVTEYQLESGEQWSMDSTCWHMTMDWNSAVTLY
ncbi:ankyrin repeat domain-containing protein [Rickettsiales endosymbiont of Peranema trichophorum]|uniref:ankyrin repeat domain-containing protein n=1 Tax=Rickettsiales endosymbiont of Peranema trichophorum TaxID=2486577 RepID=UPI001023C0BC|nr:ankyrin repeat domain-containing protein [Rickettsiales endosymbiont of Peranema trichophorum]RZI47293.1 ankyrin repeat domain-containing protein [Rickettsiales endosymbiont of Peranema trichophorum]